MANISRDTFDKSKHYVGVRLQQGVPLVDADWNEMDDIRKWELQSFLERIVGNGVPEGSDGFCVLPAEQIPNDFVIKGGDGTPEGAGRCLVGGLEVLNEADLKYSEQALYRNEDLATKWGVPAVVQLSTSEGSRSDLVYVDVWEREVDASEDPALVDERIGIPTCVRVKREWVVRVAEESSSLPAAPDGHVYCALATLNRKAGQEVIGADDIVDRRLTGLTIRPGATGRVVFPKFAGTVRTSISGRIDPGLGPGKIAVHVALEQEDQKGFIFVGPPDAAQIFGGIPKAQVGALVDPNSGTFQIGLRADAVTIKSTTVHWWAFRPTRRSEDLEVPENISVKVQPPSASVPVGGSITFTAVVSATTDERVTWKVRGVAGGNNTFGTITDRGVYKAPQSVPNPASFEVRAESKAEPNAYGTARLTVKDIELSLSPSEVTVQTGRTRQFEVKINDVKSNDAVNWSVNNVAGGNSTFGTVNTTGLYRAPNQVPRPSTVTLKATTKQYGVISKTATINIVVPTPCTAGPVFVCPAGGPGSQPLTPGGPVIVEPCTGGRPLTQPCPGSPVLVPRTGGGGPARPVVKRTRRG